MTPRLWLSQTFLRRRFPAPHDGGTDSTEARPRRRSVPPLRAAFGLAAWGGAFALIVSARRDLTGAGVPLVFLAVALLLLAERAPVAWSRERALSFAPALVFAFALWHGPGLAGAAALAAFLIQARWGARAGRTRRAARIQGANLALAAFASHLAQNAVAVRVGGVPASAAGLLTEGAAAGVAFAVLLLVMDGLTQPERQAGGRGFRADFAVVTAVGILPVILLAPLGREAGLLAGLPLLVLLAALGAALRFRADVENLRAQVEAANAMSRASLQEPGEYDARALLKRFLTLADALLHAERAVVWTLDEETGELAPAAALPSRRLTLEQRARYGQGLVGHAAARGLPRVIPDAARDPRRLPGEGASGAMLLYPIVIHDTLIGVAQWTRPVGQPFSRRDAARLGALVPQAAVALENVRIRAAMHNLAATDGMTGLWNHRHLYELLRDEMRRGARYHRPLSILMMDVDSFKSFNDTYGHPKGDELLRCLAAILLDSARTTDAVGRCGGEEFMVLLPETGKEDACRMAERIRSAVEGQAVVIVEGREVRRTVSVGVASYPEDAVGAAELVQVADEALYRAKRSGKNCVLWA